MTEKEAAKRMIIDALKIQQGPITYKALAKLVSMYDGGDCRRLRQVVADIVINGECPIVTSSDREHGGYHIAKTPEEGEKVYQEAIGRIANTQKRLKGFKIAVERWFGHATLPFEAEPPDAPQATPAPNSIALPRAQAEHQRNRLNEARGSTGL